LFLQNAIFLLFRVVLDNVVNDHIQFKANVVSRKLQLQFKDKEQSVECIRFGCTYYGSDIIKSYTLCNSSPVPISYVSVLEENGLGEEKVCINDIVLLQYDKIF